MAKRKNDKTLKTPKAKAKISKVMHEFSEGDLRSGSKKGPKVVKKSQALAIGLSEARKASKKGKSKKKK